MTNGERAVTQRFKKLQCELRQHISKKNRYVAEHAQPPFKVLDLASLDAINRHGRSAYFGALDEADGPSAPQVAGAPRDTRTALRNITDALLGRSRNAGH